MSMTQRDSPDPPTILLVIGSLQGGGAERQISELANWWAEHNWKVILATWSGASVSDFYPLDPRVQRVWLEPSALDVSNRTRIGLNFSRVVNLRELLTALRPSAVLSFITECNLLTILAGVRLNVRVVVSERVQPGFDKSLPLAWRILRRLLYAWADCVVAQTEEAAHWLKNACRATVAVIPNAIRVLPEPSGNRGQVIVAVGRLVHQKGFDVLMRAFARIALEYGNWRVVIIGEGEERKNLTRLRGELLLDKRVDLIGQIHDVASWMAAAGLVVQPSRFEGFPNAILESMALGAAVISTDCPSGPADLIENGTNGRLVPVEDVNALAVVMAELISNADERARLGRNATAVRDRYRQDLIVDRWEMCLFPECASPRPAGPSRLDGSR